MTVYDIKHSSMVAHDLCLEATGGFEVLTLRRDAASFSVSRWHFRCCLQRGCAPTSSMGLGLPVPKGCAGEA